MYEDTKWYKLAKEKYDEKTFAHAQRVAAYVETNVMIRSWDYDCFESAYQAALLHDLIEDTDFKDVDSLEYDYDVDYDAVIAIKILTNKGLPYVEYCKSIHNSDNDIAYIVKLADMKDHLSLKETLTPRLKEKYLAGLAELL